MSSFSICSLGLGVKPLLMTTTHPQPHAGSASVGLMDHSNSQSIPSIIHAGSPQERGEEGGYVGETTDWGVGESPGDLRGQQHVEDTEQCKEGLTPRQRSLMLQVINKWSACLRGKNAGTMGQEIGGRGSFCMRIESVEMLVHIPFVLFSLSSTQIHTHILFIDLFSTSLFLLGDATYLLRTIILLWRSRVAKRKMVLRSPKTSQTRRLMKWCAYTTLLYLLSMQYSAVFSILLRTHARTHAEKCTDTHIHL